MKDRDKTKEQLIKELDELRSKVAKLGRMENKDKQDNITGLVGIIDERIEIMNECFSSFVTNPAENIKNLTALCGKLLGATCALYNRLDGDMLYSAGQWQTPQDYNPVDKADGHICYDVIKRGGDEVFIMNNLLQSHYAKIDSNVSQYKLQTYIGMRVKSRGNSVGSICAVYQKNFIPNESDKKLLGIIASAIGVEEERKQAEEALKESEEKFRNLTENLNEVVYRADPDTMKATYVNNAIKSIYGYSAEEWLKDPTLWETTICSDDQERLFATLGKAHEKKENVVVEYRIMRKDGSLRWVADHITWQKDHQGKAVSLNGLMYDITERKKAEEALNLKSLELGTLTQDLRKMSAQLSEEDESSRRKFARILHEQVGQNLSAIKIQCSEILKEHCSGKPRMEKTISHILSILEDTVSSTRSLTSELYPVVLDRLGFIPAIGWYSDLILKPKELKVTTNIDEFVENLPTEYKLSLFRIVQEAFNNIIKHASATEVDIELKKVDKSIQLIIKDNGSGIDLKKIKKKKDKGIGLMLIKERALSLGGDSKVECVFDKGTKLLIEIPMKQ